MRLMFKMLLCNILTGTVNQIVNYLLWYIQETLNASIPPDLSFPSLSLRIPHTLKIETGVLYCPTTWIPTWSVFMKRQGATLALLLGSFWKSPKFPSQAPLWIILCSTHLQTLLLEPLWRVILISVLKDCYEVLQILQVLLQLAIKISCMDLELCPVSQLQDINTELTVYQFLATASFWPTQTSTCLNTWSPTQIRSLLRLWSHWNKR